jgi:hypothetical protein
MGKTSLVEQVIQDLSREKAPVAYLSIDLLVVHDAPELERRIREGIQKVAAALPPKGERTATKLKRAFTKLEPEVSVGSGPFSVRLKRHDSPIEGIESLLIALDKAAGAYKRRAVIVLDEFQQLSEMKDGALRSAAEGAVRHAVERAKHTTYLFAGSQKHLLQDMFENEDRPLYRLCQKMSLDRISAEHYHPFLQSAAKAKWRKSLSDEVIEEILNVTLRHPYYVNALCDRLWAHSKPPSLPTTATAWDALVEEDRSLMTGKVLRLAASQRGMLKAIAKTPGGVMHPVSQEFLTTIRVPSSTGNRSKEALEELDLIQQDENKAWILVDPVMAAYLKTL